MPEYMFCIPNNRIIRTVEFLSHAISASFWKVRVDLPAAMLAQRPSLCVPKHSFWTGRKLVKKGLFGGPCGSSQLLQCPI
jgi:hypothetical protein